MFDMVFGGFIAVEDRQLRMVMGSLCFVRCQHILHRRAVLGGCAVMPGGLLVMVGRRRMMLETAEGPAERPGFIRGSCGERRMQAVLHLLGIRGRIALFRFLRSFHGKQGVAMRQQRLMRGVGLVLPDLIMRRCRAMVLHRLLVMHGSSGMMVSGLMFRSHDVSDRSPHVEKESLNRRRRA
jgi:hypothetical protein